MNTIGDTRTTARSWMLALLLLAPLGVTFRLDGVSAAPRGAYDGSYDPASPTPPAGNSRWFTVVGHGCGIEPNRPSEGVALFADEEVHGGSFLNMKRGLDTEADFGGRPMETEYEFSIRVAVQSAGIATTPNFQVGFRDEGGRGRCVCLAWYRTAPQECLLAFMQSSPPGPVVPITHWNWLDAARGSETGSVTRGSGFPRLRVGDEIVEVLCAMDAWLSSHEIGRAVVGYYLWGFNDADFGHWVHPGTSAGESNPDDYSPAALAAWRRWLRERYESDPGRLKESWGRRDVDFDSVRLPSPERRRAEGGGGFPWLQAREDREIVDFNRFYGETPSRFIEHIISGMRQRAGTGRFFVLHNGNAMHGWRSIYLAIPWLDARLIANIAQGARAWRAADPHDAVFANQHLIGIHAMAAGMKRLRPFRKSRVTDAFTGDVVAECTSEFSLEMSFGQTRVFRTEALPDGPSTGQGSNSKLDTAP